VSVATGVAFGLFPALQAAGANAADALKEASARATAHAGRQRARQALVVAEIALATLLLAGATLMLRSFHEVSQVDPGFRPDGLTAGFVVLPETRYADDARKVAFYDELRGRLAALPGSPPTAVGVPMPYSQMYMGTRFDVVGAPPLPPGKANIASQHLVSPDWFQVMGVPLRAGRTFTAAEDRPAGPPVVIVNEALARAYLGGGSPIGKRIAVGGVKSRVEREIVGVVGDVRATNLEDAPVPAIYIPFANRPLNVAAFVVRAGATTGLGETLQGLVTSIDRDQPLADLSTLGKMMDDRLSKRRLNTLLLVLFGAVALLLALIGVYGVMSYTVTQRVPEIGIRIALGARPAEVVRMVVGRGLLVAAIGVAVGLAGAFAVARVLEAILYGVSPTDPLVYALTATILLGIAAVASLLPARRAAKVDPMIALRSE
jgi:putative ABC transport system permease protein